jgi:hypothetical protein
MKVCRSSSDVASPVKSGGGPPQSKTWRVVYGFNRRGSVLECASPLALLIREQMSVK